MGLNLDKKTLQYLIKNGLIKEDDLSNLIEETSSDSSLTIASSVWSFFEYLKREFSEKTASSYKNDIDNLYSYAEKIGIITKSKNSELVPRFSRMDIEKWFETLANEGYSIATIKRCRHSLRNYFDFVKNYNVETPDITSVNLPTIDEETPLDVLTNDEIRQMIQCAQNQRDRVIIQLLYEAGMRRQELIDCEISHFDFNNNTVKIFNNGNYDRIGYISDELKRIIVQFIEDWEIEVEEINQKRKQRSITKGAEYKELVNNGFLLQTSRGGKISYSTVYASIKDTAFEYYVNLFVTDGFSEEDAITEATKKVENINTDTFRHAKRAYLFSIGKSVDQVQALMGDDNKWLTKRYMSVSQKLYPESFR